MKNDCEVVRDLLPLYHDNVCSGKSRHIVEEHLNECDECKEIERKLDNVSYDMELIEETGQVIIAHEKKEQRRTFAIAAVISGMLMIPLIVCLICNLATGHGLTWFFIVLASLMVVASVSVLPLVITKYKFSISTLAFTGCLLLLFFVCCVYTSGNWFFIVSVPTMFGIFLVAAPIILNEIQLPDFFKNMKGIIVMLFDTIFLYLTLFTIGYYCLFGEKRWSITMIIATMGVIIAWFFFLIIRYIGINSICKMGLLTVAFGFIYGIINNVIDQVLGNSIGLYIYNIDFTCWQNEHINANVNAIVLVVCLTIGIALLLIGACRVRNENEE